MTGPLSTTIRAMHLVLIVIRKISCNRGRGFNHLTMTNWCIDSRIWDARCRDREAEPGEGIGFLLSSLKLAQ